MLFKSVIAAVLLATKAFTADLSGSYHYELGLNGTELGQKFAELTPKGFRIAYFNGYLGDHDQTVFSALWEKPSKPVPRYYRRGLTGPQYDTIASNLKRKGYHPIVLNGYNIANGEMRFATIWDKSPIGTWGHHRDLTLADLKATVRNLSTGGYRLTTLSGYTVGDEVRFAVTWGERTTDDWTGDWTYSVGESAVEFQGTSASLRNEYRIVDLSVHDVNGEAVFNSVWERHPVSDSGYFEPESYPIYNTYADGFKSSFASYLKQGKVPKMLTGYYAADCGLQFAGYLEDA